MAIIHEDGRGRIVRATDAYGDYYYLGDDLGNACVGAWSKEEDARAAFEAEGAEADVAAMSCDLQMDERGRRLVECAYCNQWVPAGDPAPGADDDGAWGEIAPEHRDDCEWVATRAHRLERHA
jgi:hypothetical protein